MKFIKQPENFSVSVIVEEDSMIKKHSNLLPNSIRGIICGPSNCGKTNLMISLLIHPHGLKFESIYVYSKSLYQPKYEYLRRLCETIEDISYNEYSENSNVIDPSKVKKNSIFIFDDIACNSQAKIQEHFAMGRHKNVEPFYLCQTYSKIPKQLIRDNCNLVILFRMDDLNLKHVYEDHVNTDMTFKEFRSMCSKCWDVPYGFLTIDKDSDIKDGRYRKGLDTYIVL